jgi:transcription-repair coupling factor (superfamily II helicase)
VWLRVLGVLFLRSVSNLLHLLEAYRNHPAIVPLQEQLCREGAHSPIPLSGMSGSQRCLILSALSLRSGAPREHLILAEHKEEAAYLHNDLCGILSEVNNAPQVFFFPDSFKRPAFFEDLNPTQVLQRSETVSKITDPTVRETGYLVVTYPEAIFEKVVRPEVLDENRITVQVGERLDVDFVMEVLVEYGFVRTDFVYEPGQFSIRGGIIDLFSFGNELPYRIELFDEEVESIRTFDPLTQLSRQNIRSLSIVPNLNTRFRQDQKESLFKIVGAESVVWLNDYQFVLDRLQFCFEKAEIFASKLSALDDMDLRDIFRDRAFLYPAVIHDEVTAHRWVQWNSAK